MRPGRRNRVWAFHHLQLLGYSKQQLKGKSKKQLYRLLEFQQEVAWAEQQAYGNW